MGAIDFGDEAKNAVSVYERAWFDAWLKDDRSALDALPPVRVFVTGENRWHDADKWPLAGAGTERWCLHSGGRANSLSGDGTLDREPPGDEPPDFFIYNPFDPVPSLGGHSCCLPQVAPMGPMDQRPVEYRNDVLVYTSPPLDAPYFAAGFVTARLSAATSAADTDFTVKLCDVEPDGRSINLFEGVIRGRFRESRQAEVPLEPHRVYEFAIDVGVICHLFRAGTPRPGRGFEQQLSGLRPQPPTPAGRSAASMPSTSSLRTRPCSTMGPAHHSHRPAGHPAPLTTERRT